jgi:hypothetical protein
MYSIGIGFIHQKHATTQHLISLLSHLPHTAHMSQPAVSGRGELTLPNGALYVGEWLNGKPHGKGRMVQDPISTQMFSYEGDWKEGRLHGRGLFKYSDGSFYERDWSNCKKHGKGLTKWALGDFYRGDYIEGKKHGKGVAEFATDGRTPLPAWITPGMRATSTMSGTRQTSGTARAHTRSSTVRR